LANARLADPVAWERVVRLYAPLVASWCGRWGVARQDVPDVLQDVFAAVAGHLDRFQKERPSDTFRGWLFSIARNKVWDHFRRRAGEPMAAGGTEATLRMQQIGDGGPLEDQAKWTDEVLLDDLLRCALESIKGEFHERTWLAFWGVVVEGRATADVAADLEMKPGAVRVAKSRVLLRLRRELGDAPK
jgi:RNA polymerase sigma-70 factor (ECF subfamily)